MFARSSPEAGARKLRQAVVVGAVVLVASLVGIASRMPDTLAVFWPANALLLGILLRNPRLATSATWLCAAIGYVAADVIAQTSLPMNLALNLCNIAGVAAGFAVFKLLGRGNPWLTRVHSLGVLAAVVLAASAAAGIAGGVVSFALQDLTWSQGWTQWFAGEFLNYMATIPAVLTAPSVMLVRRYRRRNAVTSLLKQIAPAAALLVLCLILVWFVRGAGAITFAMPALVVAALMTGVFVTSLFILITTVWMLMLTAEGHLGLAAISPMPVTLSMSIGLSLLAVAPLAVACVSNERQVALAALRHAVAHDDLTGALRRDEFFRRIHEAVRLRGHRPSAVLMMDLDHFKILNDTYGHSAGDAALERFADDVRLHLSDDHLFARLGGEEFAVFLPNTADDAACAIADSIRIGQYHRATEQFAGHGVTVSIGVAAGTDSIELLFDAADRALYDAKRRGRNRTVVAMPAPDVRNSV